MQFGKLLKYKLLLFYVSAIVVSWILLNQQSTASTQCKVWKNWMNAFMGNGELWIIDDKSNFEKFIKDNEASPGLIGFVVHKFRVEITE